jgi:signal transduction histidine kinase
VTPSRQSPTATIDDDATVLQAARLLADRGMFATIWLDADLRVQRTLGAMAQAIPLGQPISSSLIALIGQEDAITALQLQPTHNVTLTNISALTGPDLTASLRMNISIYWQPDSQTYLVLLGRVLSSGVAESALENAIKKRRIADEELKRINQQLEEFAYVISHDLKAPLRALRYYSSDINDALAEDTPDIAAIETAAQNIQIATKRMSNMLIGLLEYSRIGRQHDALETVDTGQLAREIVGSLATHDTIQVSVDGEWPKIRTAPVPLDLVLRNLVDNAIKHHDRDTGHIRLSCQSTTAQVTFDIADDGPGIDPEWHQAIFLPFSRIDDSRNPESSGIGLALVKRTVENAGGRIEVRSNPAIARGTTFRVTWPKR